MFNVYGPGQDLSNLRQGMVSIYLAQAFEKGQIEVKGSTNRFRDFIFIDDVVEIWFKASTYTSALGQTLNLGTGIKTTVKDILDCVCKLVPASNYFVSGATEGDQSGIYADVTQMSQCLDHFKFVELNEGLGVFAEWASQCLSNIKNSNQS